jgi:hypothetical protein
MEQNWLLYLAIVIAVVFIFCKIGENNNEQEGFRGCGNCPCDRKCRYRDDCPDCRNCVFRQGVRRSCPSCLRKI